MSKITLIERVVSRTQSKYEVVKKEITQQNSYNLDLVTRDELLKANAIKLISKNMYEVSDKFSVVLEKGIINVIGSKYDRDDNNVVFEYTDSNNKFQIKRTNNLEDEYEWFKELYDKNVEGSVFIVSLDKENQVIYFDNILPPELNITNNKNTSKLKIRSKNSMENKINLNTILYGAPGTGKTYSTPEYALAILENKSLLDIREEYEDDRKGLIEKYNEYIKEGRIVFTTFHQNYGYEDFIQGLKPDLESSEVKFKKVDGVFKRIADTALNSNDNYVIIIDEINRGNISKIFGELITLIEVDKRWGEDEQLSATLPSGDSFTVPNNLYIIGTMNSADKSISLVDAALRRRFDFIEMSPDSSLVDREFRKFLDAINKYLINELCSKDLLIGHSYFIGKDVSDFAKIVNQNIVPLLYEYFFDDEKKVKKAIQDASAPVLYTDNNGNEFVFEVIENPTGRVKYKVVKKKAS